MTVLSTRAFPEPQWDEAVALLAAARQVVLACHVGPDGDALGSMLALGLALRSRGVEVFCSWGEPELRVPTSLALLPGQDLLVPPDQVPSAPEVLVTLDTGSLDRLGLLQQVAAGAGQVLVVDHHASNTGFGTVHLVEVTAAATAVLVAELVDRLDVELDRDIATGLYAGLVTDTGSFKYAATTPAVHRLAARLLETGLRHDLLTRALYDTNSFGYVQLLGAALGRACLDSSAAHGLGLVWTWTTPEDLERYGVDLSQIEGMIDVVRTAVEAEVALVAKGDRDGTVKVSMRSKGQIDVGAVCVGLGGGGHLYAAGFTSYDDVPSTVAQVTAALASRPAPDHVSGPSPDGPHGLVVVDKPGGWTSFDVVARMRRLAGTRRVGHAGTLDPMATGVLVVGIGKATKLLGHLALTSKVYRATIRLGETTSTDDAEGEPLVAVPADALDEAVVREALAAFTGQITQVPPQISAIKVDGKRSYARARAGETVELAARTVTVSRLDLEAVRSSQATLDLDVEIVCSSGTYIRSIARDLGEALGVGGHLTALRRTAVGPYTLDQAHTLEQLVEDLALLPLDQAVALGFPRVDVEAEDARRFVHGIRLPAAGLGPGPVGVFGPGGELLALAEDRGAELRSLCVFVG